jgi:hypothetical protein
MSSENTHWLPELFKNRWVKIPIIIIAISLAILIMYLVGKSLLGYNVSFWGVQTNPEKPKVDTIVSQIFKHDTVYYPVVSERIVKKEENKTKKFLNDTSIRTIQQHGKNNLAIGGNNSGDVRVGDTYNKPPQRHLEPDDLPRIVEQLPSKIYKIKVLSNGSIEGNVFRDELLNGLYRLGYNNLVSGTVGMNINFFGTGRMTIRKGSFLKENWIEVLVNPQE